MIAANTEKAHEKNAYEIERRRKRCPFEDLIVG